MLKRVYIKRYSEVLEEIVLVAKVLGFGYKEMIEMDLVEFEFFVKKSKLLIDNIS